jgi:Transposase
MIPVATDGLVGEALEPTTFRLRALRHEAWCDGVQVLELSRLARTVRAWEAEILAWHRTAGCSNGPTEAINLLIKKVKRVGHGFRNFANYRLRLLLHCGVRWQTHRTARLRGRFPVLGGVEPLEEPARLPGAEQTVGPGDSMSYRR